MINRDPWLLYISYMYDDTIHMLCHIFGQMSRFTRIVSHFSRNVAIYAFCQVQFSADRHLKLFCTPDTHTPVYEAAAGARDWGIEALGSQMYPRSDQK